MEKVSVFIASWFINRNILSVEDEELYAYAINCLLITASPLLLVMIIGICLNVATEGIIIIIPFMIIRTYSGGIHSESPKRCFVMSTGILAVLLMMTKVISNSCLLSCIVLGACISLVICSPIENENKHLSNNEKKTYRKLTTIWVGLFTGVYIVLSFMEQNTYAVCVAMGIIITAVLQIPCLGKILLEREK